MSYRDEAPTAMQVAPAICEVALAEDTTEAARSVIEQELLSATPDPEEQDVIRSELDVICYQIWELPRESPTPDSLSDSDSAEDGPEQEAAEPAPTGFGNGTYRVGDDLEPGTYRSTGSTLCYWARLSGFGGELDDIIANGNNAPEIVMISCSDAGFETDGCGRWTPVEDTVPDTPATSFSDGTYVVGEHIEPGQYRADGGDLCYSARLSDFGHAGVAGNIANGNRATIIETSPGDAGFTSFGCGTWIK